MGLRWPEPDEISVYLLCLFWQAIHGNTDAVFAVCEWLGVSY